MLTLRTDFGCTEAIIDDNCGINKFYEIASILSNEFDSQFKVTSDEGDALLWYFPYKKNILTLNYNIFTGISLFTGKYREAATKENESLADIAQQHATPLG